MANNKKPTPQPKKTNLALICAIIVALAAVAAGVFFLAQSKNNPSNPESVNPTGSPDSTIHHVQLEIKDYGKIVLELDASVAPITVDNFMDLVGSGFYDGLTFHRIMEGFMMQGGDPQGDGFGGSDKTIKGEFTSNGWENNISHVRGTISMARSNNPDSASSQFFIVHQDSTFLDGNYAAFGHVTEGMDVVDKVCTDAKPIDDNGTIPAEAQPVITSATILD